MSRQVIEEQVEQPELDDGVAEAVVIRAANRPGPPGSDRASSHGRHGFGDVFEWTDPDSQDIFRFTYHVGSLSWQATCRVHEAATTARGGRLSIVKKKVELMNLMIQTSQMCPPCMSMSLSLMHLLLVLTLLVK